MKDNAANIVAGILIQGEIQRRNDEILREQQDKNARLKKEKDDIEKAKVVVQKQNKALAVENSDLEYEAEVLQHQNAALYNKAVELQQEVDYFKELLCQPMKEIAEKSSTFGETYEKQMELMAEWMVSQKAFKELAIQLGLSQGLKFEEVIQMGNNKKIDVLDDKHNPSHGSNASAVEVINKRKDRLREKILGNENK